MNYSIYSNQQVINAFYSAVEKLNAAGQALSVWGLLVQANLQSISDARSAQYACGPIENLGLAANVQQGVIDELAAMRPAFLNEVTTRPDVLLPVPWFSQLDEYSPDGADCGHSCVLMLLKYYDTPPSNVIHSDTTVSDLVKLMHVIDIQKDRPRRNKNETSAGDLVELAAANGLQLTQDLNFTSLDRASAELDNRRAVILLVDYESLKFPPHLVTGTNQGWHWLVITGQSDNGQKFIVHDPLWYPHDRNRRGGEFLEISRETLKLAMRLNWAVY